MSKEQQSSLLMYASTLLAEGNFWAGFPYKSKNEEKIQIQRYVTLVKILFEKSGDKYSLRALNSFEKEKGFTKGLAHDATALLMGFMSTLSLITNSEVKRDLERGFSLHGKIKAPFAEVGGRFEQKQKEISKGKG